MSGYPSAAEYSMHTGESFFAQVDSTEIELTLDVVSDAIIEGPYERFTLEFAGPQNPRLLQATYRLRNDAMGVLEVFLVPISANDTGTRYEAVFSLTTNDVQG
ncbi:MAG: hypothetical protein PF636_09685 [Actinomycetota bacterium]|nr:hypothetical protein [Actinomycetota bacterium]